MAVQLEDHGSVSVVTLDRPSRLNSLDLAALGELTDTLADVARGSSRVVVLSGAGSSFCAGLDLAVGLGASGTGSIEDTYQFMRVAVGVVLQLREMPQPVVAAVHGHAVGGGFAIAAMADLRVVAPDARFDAGFLRLGMSPGDLGLSWVLPRQVGTSVASRLFFGAGSWTADVALANGFAAYGSADPVGRALELAHEMSRMPRLALQQTKELMNLSLGLSGLRQHLEVELRTQIICSLTEDHAAAVREFRARKAAAVGRS